MGKNITVYPAAALFNGRETLFNFELVSLLERKGYSSLFPQRDGFEFGRLNQSLEDKLSKEELPDAVQQIIYYLDMGFFIPNSDVVIANLDEPQDEGVVAEIRHAKLMNKLVIGYRTDVRSPYGSIKDKFGGAHFFPAFQCDSFIIRFLPCRTELEKTEGLKDLAEKIDYAIQKRNISKKDLPKYCMDNPHISKELEGAKILFSGIKDIHSDEGLEEIAERYIKSRLKLNEIFPEVIR